MTVVEPTKEFLALYPEFYLLHSKYTMLNPEVEKVNAKLWACMYWSALKETCNQAKIHGPVSGFANSPISKGKLQFDLALEDSINCNYIAVDPKEFLVGNPNYNIDNESWLTLKTDIKEYGVRNLNLISIQPTASSVQVIPCTSENVEFPICGIYNRKVIAGEFTVVNDFLVRELESKNLWSATMYDKIVADNGSVLLVKELDFDTRNLYRTAYEIPQMFLVKLAAQRQFYIDHSQSMSLFMRDASAEKLLKVHMHIHKTGVKTGIYYLHGRQATNWIQLPTHVNADDTKKYLDLDSQSCSLADKDNGTCLMCSS